MTISKALQKAWKTYIASPGDTLAFLIVEACLMMICLAPLLFLSRAAMAPFAAVSACLWLLIMLPARMNAAEAMRDAMSGGKLCSPRLISPGEYGAKLIYGLKRLGFLLLWAAPLIALAAVSWHHFSGEVDSFTVLRMIKNNLGGGDQMTGILRLLLILLGALLLLMLGGAFHSGARHAWAQGDKRLVRGHHGKIVLCWLASLIGVLPMILAVLWTVARYLPVIQNLNGLLMGTVSLPATRNTLMILGAGAVLTIPLLPLRSLIPAAYVEGLKT